MKKVKSRQHRRSTPSELQDLIRQGQEEFPGIAEVLEVYGAYEDIELAMKEYFEATKPLDFITTSNQTSS